MRKEHEKNLTNLTTHVHPAPAFVELFAELADGDLENIDDETFSTIIANMDIALRLGMFLERNKIQYEKFSKCPCDSMAANNVEEFLAASKEDK
jgi:hypothetical protein